MNRYVVEQTLGLCSSTSSRHKVSFSVFVKFPSYLGWMGHFLSHTLAPGPNASVS